MGKFFDNGNVICKSFGTLRASLDFLTFLHQCHHQILTWSLDSQDNLSYL